mgnify:FL=1
MSVSVAGNIDCAITVEQKRKLADIWDDGGSVSAEYLAVTEAVQAVRGAQTGRFSLLEEPDKDYQLKVWWPDDCRSGEPDDCEDECAVDGPVAGTQCVEYALTDCFGHSWGITEKMFRTSDMTEDELIAVEMLKTMKIMDEKLDRKAISLLMAARGTNKYAGQYTVNGLVTEIPPAAWNPDLVAYLWLAAKKNKQTLPKVLTDTNLTQLSWLIANQTTDPMGASAALKFNQAFGDMNMDINMDDYLGHKATFLWQGNSLFIANQARNSGKDRGRKVQHPTTGVFVTRDVMESKNIPGITYDLFMSEVCVPGGDIKRSWRMQFRGGFFSNPTGCDTDRTGVLELRCV